MLLSILDVLIGLTVVYLVLSTVASALVDFVEALFRRRGALLARCLEEIFAGGDAGLDRVALASTLRDFYNSPHIASLFPGQAHASGVRLKVADGRLPSYIPPERFAMALEELAPADAAFSLVLERIRAALPEAANPQAQRAAVAQYFEQAADRFSGWYRRWVRWILLASGFLLAVALNADSLRIATQLSQDPALRSLVISETLSGLRSGTLNDDEFLCDVAADTDCAARVRELLDEQLALVGRVGLPLGWTGDPLAEAWSKRETPLGMRDLVITSLSKLAGVIVTALAVCLGAPFWFDFLNKLGSARSSLKPDRGPGPDPAP